jgi:tRNA (mo5U34)-methyltransferase
VSDLQLPPDVDVELLKDLTYSRPWFHSIDLGHGVMTPGIDQSWAKLQLLDFPESLEGKSVLDVGAFDGFFSFESERRGAARVVASDEYCWSQPGDPMTDGRGFDIAHWALQSRVEKRWMAVEQISPETVGTFDVVLSLGVLYH